MPEVIKVKANEEGRYPFTLYGTHYELEPVDDARSETATSNKKRASAGKPDTSPDKVGQPINDNPEQEDNTK